MIGKFIVYEGYIRDRYKASEVTGETKYYWRVKTMVRDRFSNPVVMKPEFHRMKKDTLEVVAIRDTLEDAQYVATCVTEDMKQLTARYKADHQKILEDAR